jgi:hypothetical protein
MLARHEADPQIWQAPLAAELTQAEAGEDTRLAAATQALMELVDTAGARSGKYAVTIFGARGAQVGDQNTQTNTFGSGPG